MFISFWLNFVKASIFDCFGRGLFITGIFLLVLSPFLSWRAARNMNKPLNVRKLSPFVYTMQ